MATRDCNLSSELAELLTRFHWGVWVRPAGRDDRLRSIALSIVGLQLFGLAGAVAETIVGLVLWEWRVLIIAKARGTSIAKLIPMEQTLESRFCGCGRCGALGTLTPKRQ